jgi:photosystem II stability/assembly factor-like uncharacterized protein
MPKKKRVPRKAKPMLVESSQEDFSLKVKWFMRHRDPGGGRSLKEVYDAALLQAHRMDSHIHESPPLPEKALKTATLALAPGIKATVQSARNPNPKGALRFASSAVKISSRENLLNSVLYLPLDRKLSADVDSNTICIFRYVEQARRWAKLPVCGVSKDGRLAWARVHEPGTYIALGLPADPVLQASLLALYLNRDSLSQASLKDRDDVARRILNGMGRLAVFLSGGMQEEERFEPGAFSLPGLQPAGFPADLPLPGGRMPEGGFAEWDILEDICPPWFGKGGLRIPSLWPKIPIRWPPPFPFPFPFPCVWRPIGPFNINGRIASICNHPTNSNILYAGAANGGVWKTTNAGTSWTHKWVHEDSMAVGSIALCRDFPHVLYAATGEDTPGWSPSYPGVGVYRSTDSGDTWTRCPGGGMGDRCMKILVHPSNLDVAYVASNSGFYKTVDGGATPWTLIHTGHCTDAVMDPSNPLIIYLAIWNDGIYKTTDGGATWNAANGMWQLRRVGLFFELFWRGIPTGTDAEWIALAIGKNGTGGSNFLIAKLGVNSGDIYRTSNGGNTWSRIATSVEPVSYNEWTNICAVNPDNHQILLAGGVGLSRSTNGATFSPTAGTHSDHQQLIFDPNSSNTCYVATDGGVYKSTDGGQNWSLMSFKLQATQLLSFGIGQNGSFLAGGATQDQGVIQTSGSTGWIDNGGGNEWGIFVVDQNDSQNIYISPSGGQLRQSTDGGSTWTTLTTGLTDIVGGVGTSSAITYDIAAKPGDSNVLLFAGYISDASIAPPYFVNRIWRSTNKGVLFTGVFTMVDTPTKVLFAPSDGNVAYVTCSSGRVFKSSSSGISGGWAEPYTALNRPVATYISSIAIAWNDPNLVFIGYGGFGATRIMRSMDGGAHWTDISGSIPTTALPLIPINAIAVDQYDTAKIYVGTDIGIFRTTDNGANWSSFNNTLNCDHPRIIVTGLHLHKANNALYSGTMGRGAYRRYL